MAQVYRRIANPYMPNGTPDKTNAPTPLLAPGEVGCYFNDQNTQGDYLRVLVDSGCTSATPVGIISQGQLAFWKDQSQGLVTNDSRFCDLPYTGPSNATYPFINRVAGVFQLTPTVSPGVNGTDGNPQLYAVDLIVNRRQSLMAITGTPLAGQLVTADNIASSATGFGNAVSTAAPSQVLGVVSSPTVVSTVNSLSLYSVDINIGFAQ